MNDVHVKDKPGTKGKAAAAPAAKSGPLGARIERKEDVRFLTGAASSGSSPARTCRLRWEGCRAAGSSPEPTASP